MPPTENVSLEPCVDTHKTSNEVTQDMFSFTILFSSRVTWQHLYLYKSIKNRIYNDDLSQKHSQQRPNLSDSWPSLVASAAQPAGCPSWRWLLWALFSLLPWPSAAGPDGLASLKRVDKLTFTMSFSLTEGKINRNYCIMKIIVFFSENWVVVWYLGAVRLSAVPPAPAPGQCSHGCSPPETKGPPACSICSITTVRDLQHQYTEWEMLIWCQL